VPWAVVGQVYNDVSEDTVGLYLLDLVDFWLRYRPAIFAFPGADAAVRALKRRVYDVYLTLQQRATVAREAEEAAAASCDPGDAWVLLPARARAADAADRGGADDVVDDPREQQQAEAEARARRARAYSWLYGYLWRSPLLLEDSPPVRRPKQTRRDGS
jgi:hypothetical protein